MESLKIIIGDFTICCEGPSLGKKGLSDVFRSVAEWFMNHRPNLVLSFRRIFLKDPMYRCACRPDEYVPCNTRLDSISSFLLSFFPVTGVLMHCQGHQLAPRCRVDRGNDRCEWGSGTWSRGPHDIFKDLRVSARVETFLSTDSPGSRRCYQQSMFLNSSVHMYLCTILTVCYTVTYTGLCVY